MPAQITLPPLPVQLGVVYRYVPDFPGYCVGDDGSVWTCRRKGGNDRGANRMTDRWRRLSLHSAAGYKRVNFIRDGKNHSWAVHCVVLTAFAGPCPPGMEGCHYPNQDKTDNRLANLRWDTHAENMKDKYRDAPRSDEKRCRRCAMLKPLSDFYEDGRSTDGRQTECRKCHQQVNLQTRDLDKKRAANRDYMRRRRASAKHRGALESPVPLPRG